MSIGGAFIYNKEGILLVQGVFTGKGFLVKMLVREIYFRFSTTRILGDDKTGKETIEEAGGDPEEESTREEVSRR